MKIDNKETTNQKSKEEIAIDIEVKKNNILIHKIDTLRCVMTASVGAGLFSEGSSPVFNSDDMISLKRKMQELIEQLL